MHVAQQRRFFAGFQAYDFPDNRFSRNQRHHRTNLEAVLPPAQDLQTAAIVCPTVDERNIVMRLQRFGRHSAWLCWLGWRDSALGLAGRVGHLQTDITCRRLRPRPRRTPE